MQTHPFNNLHGGLLQLKDWTTRLDAINAELDALKPADRPEMANETVNTVLLDDPTQMDIDIDMEEPLEDPLEISESQQQAVVQAANDQEEINRLQLTRRYYLDAIAFIETIHGASEIVCHLLSSKNKSEVIEAMDFFKVLDAYRIETAKSGIRKMLRLIWTKGNSDEGKGIQTHLIDSYKTLFFDAPPTFSENDSANYISRNMISLTFDTSPAELTSLEQLLATMMKDHLIPDLVLKKLWQVYGIQQRDISKKQRRGAIIVLGMLALAEPEIVLKQLESILRIGLGPLGRADLALAKYTCVALKQIGGGGGGGRAKETAQATMNKLPTDHAVLGRLAALLEIETENREW